MELNAQVNTFTGGMNLDDDVTMIPKTLYKSAHNVRLITNDSGTSGVLLNIEKIKKYAGGLNQSEEIIGTSTTQWYDKNKDQVVECGVVITKENINNSLVNHVWVVTDFDTSTPTWHKIVSATLDLTDRLSIVSNFESNEINKIYITDGNSNIKMINIAKQYDSAATKPIENKYQFDVIPEAVLFPVTFDSFTFGALEAGSVQYCFQLFNKYGTESTVSPLSNVIPLSDTIRNGETKKILGLLSKENSGLGCILNISFNNTSQFNKLRVIRIHYTTNIQIPDITVLNEIDINPVNTNINIKYTDNGALFLTKLNYDEFSALIPYDFNAKTLVQLDNRLFAANVKENTWDVEYDARAYRCDSTRNVKLLSNSEAEISGNITDIINRDIPKQHDCINPYNVDLDNTDSVKYIYRSDGKLGGTGKNISYRFVFAELVISSTATETNKPVNDLDLNATSASTKTIKIVDENGKTVADQSVVSDNAVIHNYSDAYVCSHYTGYMRDEIYRFGIVFYNKKGIPSPVHWIGDIRMPSIKDATTSDSVLYPFHTGAYSNAYKKTVEQLGYSMGIEFTVNNVPQEAVSWEIVRCDRTEADRTIVSQGILGSLVEFGKVDVNAEYSFGENDIRPKPIINMGGEFHVKFMNVSASNTFFMDYPCAKDYFEFISPEICVSKDSILQSIQNSKLNRLYSVSTYNHQAELTNDRTGHAAYDQHLMSLKQLGYKQNSVSTIRGDEINDNWFACASAKDFRSQLYFHGGSGPGYLENQGRYWYEKQCLFKYYNIKHDFDKTNYKINDAIIGASLPYNNSLEDSKNHAQTIGTKMYTNTSVAGYQQYGNHGINCILHVDSSFTYNAGNNGTYEQVFNYLNTASICNIKRTIIPYGGNDYSSRTNSIYISCGEHHSADTSKCYCFGGDTFLNIFDHLNTAICLKSNDADEWKSLRMNTVCYIPLESIVNTAMFSSKSYHNSVNGTVGNNLILNEPIVLGSGYAQQKPLYEYNPAYSVQSEALHYVSKNLYSIDNLHSANRITCSEVKFNNEVIDSWTKFKFANYIDVDSQYGPITNLKVFKDRLYFFLNSAVGIASVNERSLITDNNPGELVLGTGGILTRFDYLVVKNGNSIVNDKSIVNSETTLYWYDFDKNTLCALGNGFAELSKLKNIQSYLNSNPRSLNNLSLYDSKYNEIWFKVNDKCVVYNEKLLVFTSYYTHTPDWYLPLSTKTVTIKNNECCIINSDALTTMPHENSVSNITFVINDNVMYTKTFDNQWFTADISDECLKEIVFKTKTQETEPIDYTNIELREDNYRFAIGREKQDDPVQQQKTNTSYAGRMRGKYLICNYTFDCNNNREFKLPYVKTTYRYSML